MKGQLSLELIVVLAIFLAVLSVWLVGVKAVEGTISLAMGTQRAAIAADKLSSAINSVCIMGDGNMAEIRLSLRGNASASYNGSLLFRWNNKIFVRRAYCRFNSFTAAPSLTIENQNGTLHIV